MSLETLLALVAGVAVGFLIGRVAPQSGPAPGPGKHRPTKRQRQILDTLPPDPVAPSIEELVLEEAESLGILDIPGATGVPVHVRLKVWKRDHGPLDSCPSGAHQYRLKQDVEPTSATETDLELICMDEPRRSGSS